MQKIFLPIGLLLLLSMVPPTVAAERIVIAGTGDSQQLLRVLAADYESSHPRVSIELPESIGSSGGIKSVVKGGCDLARIARPLTVHETALGLSAQAYPVGEVN